MQYQVRESEQINNINSANYTEDESTESLEQTVVELCAEKTEGESQQALTTAEVALDHSENKPQDIDNLANETEIKAEIENIVAEEDPTLQSVHIDKTAEENGNTVADPVVDITTQIALLLKTEREKQGLSLGEVTAVTKFRANQVDAMENGHFSVLPVGFAKGFIRHYAKFLGIDNQVNPLLNEVFNSSTQSGSDSSKLNSKLKEGGTYCDKRKSSVPWKFLLLILCNLLIIFAIYLWQTKSNLELKKQSQVQSNQVDQIVATPKVDLDNVQVVPLQQDERLVEVLTSEQSVKATEATGTVPAADQVNSTLNARTQSAEGASGRQLANVSSQPPQIDFIKKTKSERNLTSESVLPVGQPTGSLESSNNIAVANQSRDMLAIKVGERSRLTVYDATGKVLINKIVPGDTSHQLKGQPPYRVRLTNANGATISHAGVSQVFDEQDEEQVVTVNVP